MDTNKLCDLYFANDMGYNECQKMQNYGEQDSTVISAEEAKR